MFLSNITNKFAGVEYGLLPYLEVKTVSDVICLKCDFYMFIMVIELSGVQFDWKSYA